MRHRFGRQPITVNSVKGLNEFNEEPQNGFLRNVIQATAVKVGSPTNLLQQRNKRCRILLQGVVCMVTSILTLTIASPLFNMDVLDLAKPVV